MQLFSGVDFFVQFIWIVVCGICDVIYSYEKEKTMFANQFFILKQCQYCCILNNGQSQNF